MSAKASAKAKLKKRSAMKKALEKSRALARPDVFAVNVKRIREGLGLTQVQLAERLGWGQARIAQIECGSQDRRISTVQRLAAALGVEEIELITECEVAADVA